LLQSVDAAPATAFSLRCVDYLPCLVVLLFQAIPRLRKIENDGNQHAEAPQILEDLEKRPVAENVSKPFPAPLKGPERNAPRMLDALPANGPGKRPLSINPQSHG